MSPTPTGRLHGDDLTLTRTFRAPIDDVWASLTDPEKTARWYGPWEGEAVPGGKIRVQMAQEEGKPWTDMTIDACEAPRRLALSSVTDFGSIFLDLTLTERNGVTDLRFIHRLTDKQGVGEFGPGWEFYLDALTAAREGMAMPDFNDYYPSQKEYYEAQG